MNGFLDVSIFPTHAKNKAVVAWITVPEIKDAEFYIYRKWDGGAEWELLNTEPVYGTTYADTQFTINNKLQVPSYRLLAIKDGKEYESPEIAVYSKIDRKAFGVAQNIIRGLYFQARQDGIPVLYYPAKKNGAMSSSLDDLTGQRESATCTGGDGDDPSNDYGQFYDGGYYRPFLTYVRMLGAKRVKENVLDEGLFDNSIQHALFLAFPPVRSNDLVVDVSTDRRWIVGKTIQAQLVKSVIPVAYRTEISLQEHNHPCYSVPIPDNYPELIRRLTWPQI